MHFRGIQRLEVQYYLVHLDERQHVTFSLKGQTTNTSQHVEFFHSLIFFKIYRCKLAARTSKQKFSRNLFLTALTSYWFL